MFSNLLLATTLLLSLIDSTLAKRNVWSTVANGVGASMILKDSKAVETGFDAKFYSYPALDFIPFWNDDFVAGGYSSNKILASTSQVTDPNFHITRNIFSAEVYGLLNINVHNVLIELTGYFVRMYYSQLVQHYCLFF